MQITKAEQAEIRKVLETGQATTLSLADMLKIVRNFRLKESDWTQLPDVNLPNLQEWVTYRQALRDITKQATFPQTVVWPVQPQ
jgi:hypothetical protein